MPKPGEPQAAFRAYLAELQRNLASGIAKENTHRHALQDLLEALDPTLSVFNDPKHIDVGAPDFTIRRKGQELFPVGWIETKDIGEDLSKVAKSEQLQRYFGLASLILTDYLEFRWYTDGKLRLSARIATVGPRNKLVRDAKGEEAVTELLTEFLKHSFQEVTSPRDLATRMADLAHIIRDITLKSYNAEADKGSLHLHSRPSAKRSFRTFPPNSLQTCTPRPSLTASSPPAPKAPASATNSLAKMPRT